MLLIKELGSRTTTSSAGKQTKRKWGLFECPACHIQKEYNMQKGTKNKTCGSAGCRKQFAEFNSWNANFKEEDKMNNIPHYVTFRAYYKELNSRYVLDSSIDTLEKFKALMFDDYVAARGMFDKVTLVVYSNDPISSSNSKWGKARLIKPNSDETMYNGMYHTLHLEDELIIPKEDTDKLIIKLFPSKIKEIVYFNEGSTLSNPTKSYLLSADEMLQLRQAIREHQRITSNNYIYAIRGAGTSFVKLGKTTDIANRLDDVNTHSPFDLEVEFCIPIGTLGKIEQRVHKYAIDKGYHCKREWFTMTKEEVEGVKHYLESIVSKP